MTCGSYILRLTHESKISVIKNGAELLKNSAPFCIKSRLFKSCIKQAQTAEISHSKIVCQFIRSRKGRSFVDFKLRPLTKNSFFGLVVQPWTLAGIYVIYLITFASISSVIWSTRYKQKYLLSHADHVGSLSCPSRAHRIASSNKIWHLR